MKRYKRWLPIVALLLVAFGVNLDRFGIDLERLASGGSGLSSESTRVANAGTAPAGDVTGPAWSSTNPAINLRHVFDGEINRSGKPVGFHSRPGGTDPARARVKRLRDRPNRLGVYTAEVEIADGNRWLSKFSSFFPDELSRDEVVDVIVKAYAQSPNPRAQPWTGASGLGFSIQGYTSNRGGINTAFPIYTANP